MITSIFSLTDCTMRISSQRRRYVAWPFFVVVVLHFVTPTSAQESTRAVQPAPTGSQAVAPTASPSAAVTIPAAPTPPITAPTVTLELTPSSLELRDSATARVVATLRNSSDRKLTDVRLMVLHNLPIDIQPPANPDTEVAPHSAGMWTFEISPNKATRAAGAAQVGISYEWTDDKQVAHRDVKFGPLTLTAAARPAVTELATFAVNSTLQSVSEQRPGVIHLVLSNISKHPLTLDEVSTYGPVSVDPTGSTGSAPNPASVQPDTPFLTFSIPGRQGTIDLTAMGTTTFAFGDSIDPGETLVIPVYVTAASRIAPGSFQLVFRAYMSWDTGDPAFEGSATLLATHDLSAGVLGESELYKLIGVPSLLFLPGFLIVLTWRFLWNVGLRLDKSQAEFVLQLKDASFYLLAVTLSGLAALVYPLITKHDYLTTYGYADLSLLWIGSIGVAAVLYLIVYFIKRAYERAKLGPKITIKDTPMQVLDKLDPLQLGVLRDPVKVTLHGKEYTGFLMEETGGQLAQNTNYLVAPRVVVKMKTTTDAAEVQKITDWKACIDSQQNLDGDAKEVAEAVKEASDANLAEVKWITEAGWLNKPFYLGSDKIRMEGGDSQLVEVKL